MLKHLSKFAVEENGAVTVDFVVLTAAIVVLALLTVVGFRDETVTTAQTTAQILLDYDMDVPGITE